MDIEEDDSAQQALQTYVSPWYNRNMASAVRTSLLLRLDWSFIDASDRLYQSLMTVYTTS